MMDHGLGLRDSGFVVPLECLGFRVRVKGSWMMDQGSGLRDSRFIVPLQLLGFGIRV